MDLLKALLKKILIAIPSFIVIALFASLAFYLYKVGMSKIPKKEVATSTMKDILPPPGSLHIGGGAPPTPNEETNKLNSRNGESGGDNTVIIRVGENGVYTTDNTSSVDNSTHIIEIPKNDLRNGKNVIVSSGGYATSTSSSGVYTNKNIYLETNPYIKNLSLQKNSYVTSGITVTGNTTSAFALHGTFILDIENKKGDIVVSSVGKIINYKTGAFSVKVGNIPKYMGECTLVFRNENYTENRALDREVRVPANCG